MNALRVLALVLSVGCGLCETAAAQGAGPVGPPYSEPVVEAPPLGPRAPPPETQAGLPPGSPRPGPGALAAGLAAGGGRLPRRGKFVMLSRKR